MPATQPVPEQVEPADLRAARGSLAGLERQLKKKRDDAELLARIRAARQLYTELKLHLAIEQAVAKWPPLEPEQRNRLALLLHGGAA